MILMSFNFTSRRLYGSDNVNKRLDTAIEKNRHFFAVCELASYMSLLLAPTFHISLASSDEAITLRKAMCKLYQTK